MSQKPSHPETKGPTSATGMKSGVVKMLGALAGVTVVSALATAALGFLAVRAVGDFQPDGRWTADAVPERELSELFGVRIPARPTLYLSRQGDPQHSYFEVLFELPSGTLPLFLSSNHLQRGERLPLPEEVTEVLQSRGRTTTNVMATQLLLTRKLRADGGTWLSRSGSIIEATPGGVWVHLTASGTEPDESGEDEE
jgi:hypothetical protein